MTTWSRRLIRGNPGGALKRAGRLGAAAVLFGLVAGVAGAQTIGDARGAAASIVDELLPLASLPHSSAWQVDPNFHAREISGKDFLSAASDCGSHPGVSRKMVRAAASVDYYRQFKHGSLGFFDAVGKFDDKAHARKFIADMRPNPDYVSRYCSGGHIRRIGDESVVAFGSSNTGQPVGWEYIWFRIGRQVDAIALTTHYSSQSPGLPYSKRLPRKLAVLQAKRIQRMR